LEARVQQDQPRSSLHECLLRGPKALSGEELVIPQILKKGSTFKGTEDLNKAYENSRFIVYQTDEAGN